MIKTHAFNTLNTSDLIIDAVYEGGSQGNMADEPIHKILPGISNQSGFRVKKIGKMRALVVLYSSLGDTDWPDAIDSTLGMLTYFGDNKKPGQVIHKTSKGGNKLLAEYFENIHNALSKRNDIPPFFIFTKHPTVSSKRSVQFRGVAVPGHPSLSSTQDLVAIWKSTDGSRFQNYKSTFSILNIPVINRQWIDDILAGNHSSDNAPSAWKTWIKKGSYQILTSEPTTNIRSIKDQTPDNKTKLDIIEVIYNHFKSDPFLFEDFAAKIFEMHDEKVIIDEITRNSVDGGRDAIGRYRFGIKVDPIYVDFSLEAKCYRPKLSGNSANSVGVKEVARLVSRIRMRQFGVLVTTSVIGEQAYKEVREDGHPIIFICGKDIAEILISHGYASITSVKLFINNYLIK